MTQSPTKPRVIIIPNRNPSATPPKQTSPVVEEGQQLPLNHKPATPPETPLESIGLGISSIKSSRPGYQRSSSIERSLGATYPYTPPNSRISTPRAKSTVRRTVTVPSTNSRPRDSASSTPFSGPCNDRIDLILGELEAAINNFPTARLYLDSPVVQYICLLSAAKPSSVQSPCYPSTPLSAAPHSRYSIFRPLSSHPVTTRATPSYRGVQINSASSTSQARSSRCSPYMSARSPFPDHNPTLSALRIVFPQAPAALLDSLHATYLALNYISSLSLASSNTCSKRPSTPSPKPSVRSFSSIPPKALATLGIQTSMPSPAGTTSWLRSATPNDKQDMSNASTDTAKLRERRENLQISLRILVRGLLGEIEGRRLAKRDESLVRAVGEVVRCGANVSAGL